MMNEVTSKKRLINMDKVKPVLRHIYEEYIKFPAYILAHPLKGFDMFKREKRARMSVAISFIIVLFILQIVEYAYTGFIVNPYDDIRFLRTFRELFYIIVPLGAITVANWSVTTLFDGKGKMKEIFMMLSYSLFPLIWAKIFAILFSNVIVVGEVGLYSLILVAGSFLLGYMVFFGLISIHEYGLVKCILSIVGTIIALLVLFFIVMLCFDLFQKIYGFIYTIYREITLRYM